DPTRIVLPSGEIHMLVGNQPSTPNSLRSRRSLPESTACILTVDSRCAIETTDVPSGKNTAAHTGPPCRNSTEPSRARAPSGSGGALLSRCAKPDAGTLAKASSKDKPQMERPGSIGVLLYTTSENEKGTQLDV